MRLKIFLLLVLLFSFSYPAVCGNNICEEPYENSCTCSIDCGLCRGSAGICKEFKCVNSVCTAVTISNCCGNNKCEYPEDYGNCPADCKPTKISALLISPNLSSYFVRGEKLIFKVRVTSHGRKVITADVNLKSPLFGTLKLYNDGTHNDEKAYDNIYTNTFTIGKNVKPGIYDLNLDANFMNVFTHLKYKLQINPKLDFSVSFPKEIVLGDFIEGRISIFKKNIPCDANLQLQLLDSHNNVVLSYTEKTQSYFLSYHTSLAELSGTWKLKIFAEDENKNSATKEIKIKVYPAETLNILRIKLLEPTEPIRTDQNFSLKVEVTDYENTPIKDANVKLITPEKEFLLKNLNNGQYQIFLDFNARYNVGLHKWQISASKKISNTLISGSKEFNINFTPSTFFVDVLQPKRRAFNVGETLQILLHCYYADNEPVRAAKISTLLNNQKLNFVEIEPGFYKAEVMLTADMQGKHTLEISLKDSFANYAKKSIKIEIAGINIIAFIQQNLNFILTILFSALFLLALFYYLFTKQLTRIKLKMEKEKIISLEKDLQRKYFEEAKLTKKEYEKLMQEYEKRLSEIKRKLGEEQ